MTELYDMLICH